MKYFTSEWWEGGSENAQVLFDQYAAYLASVRHRLPPELVAFDGAHTLHDAELASIACDFETGTLTMLLNGWSPYDPVRYTLRFEGVSRFEQKLPARENGRSEQLGALGYWEHEALDSATEARMLFASSAEFCIVFSGFSYKSIST